jgi:predicted MFS family arabinose efflux permease
MTENIAATLKSILRPRRLKAKAVLIVCAFLIMGAYLARNPRSGGILPWEANLTGENFSYAARDKEGMYYAIDSGEARLLCFDETGAFRWDAETGTVLRLAAPSEHGKVWVTSYVLNDSDRIIQADILGFDRNGRRAGVLLSRSYRGEDSDLPMYTSGYLGLVSDGQWLYYIEKHTRNVTLYRVDTGLKAPDPEVVAIFPYPEAEKLTLSVAYDPAAEAVYTVDKFGVLWELSPDGDHKNLAYPADAEDGLSLPCGICVSGGVLYVSDIGRRELYRLRDGAFELAADLGRGAAIETDSRLYYWISGTPEGRVLLISQYDLRRYGNGDDDIESLGASFAFNGAKRLSLWLWWIFAGTLGLGALILICRTFGYAYRVMGMERLMSSVILVVVVTVVTVLVMIQFSDSFNKRFSSTTIGNLSALSSMTAAAVDGDALMRIDGLEDYQSADYEKLRQQLAPIYDGRTASAFYENGEFRFDEANWDHGIYRMLIRTIGDRVCYVYSSADQWGAVYPMDYPYAGTEYQIVYEQGIQIVFPSVVDFSGEYTYVLTPVRNSRREVVGALEMGVNLRTFRREMFAAMREIALRAAVTVCVVLLLLKEIMFAAEVFRQRTAGRRGAEEAGAAPGEEKRPADVGAVRPLMFLLYSLECFSLVVSPLFARSLYTEALGMPMEVGVAIAYSATFFFLGAAAVAGGWAGERIGLFPLLLLGAALLFAGELLSVASRDLWVFTAAKSLVGMGVGLVQNCADVIAAAPEDPRDVERGFSMSNVGYNSGTNCGLVIGTAVGLLWGYRSVYLASALIAVLMLAYILFVYGKTGLPKTVGTRRSGQAGRGAKRGFLRFVSSPRVLGFFLLILFPYMLCNAFTYYFLPLTGAAYGMGEENISRVIFVYGMISIYLGPALTRRLLDVFRERTALAVGGFLIAAALLVYALKPDLTVLLASTAVFALADSFAFTTQSLYFARMPETRAYGAGAALGVSNVVSGLAQSLSSYCFAAAMVLGTRTGLGVVGIGTGILMILFLFTKYDKKRVLI